MDIKEQKKQAQAFVDRWQGRGDEKQDTQRFWIDLLSSVLGIERPTEFILFEERVKSTTTNFVDGWIDGTKVMIEQKSMTVDLHKGIRQSDGSLLTPYQQAKRYAAEAVYSRKPRWIITCNFQEFHIYDMEVANAQAIVIKLEDLPEEAYRLAFLVDKSNEHLERELKISMQAGEIVSELYDGLLGQYINPESQESLHAINQLIVRLVFCLYAEDAGIFGHKLSFHDYLARFEARDFRRGLIDLFRILDTPVAERDPYEDETLLAFPYVNGGMFAEKNIEIPNFTEDLRQLILEHASSNFDWSEISPTIFGAVFESTLNPETRRSGGMHYTSIENIHKVIDPLFLDSLKDELNTIRQFKQVSTLEQKAKQFQRKLASLTFFDPACGSGNFLTETYIALRRLENEAIKLYMGDTVALDTDQDLVQVKLNQFYGIEINDFAVSVAKTALWIAESQMLEATKDIVFANIDFLPLKSYTNIVEGNALLTDWGTVVDKTKLNYIIGNPPFVGKKEQTPEQKKQLLTVFEGKKVGNIDYVSAWYYKALRLIEGTQVRCAFVSTNSITQGEQVPLLWSILLQAGIELLFAYPSFVWSAETKSSETAKVHCVIIGFQVQGANPILEKTLIYDQRKEVVTHINPYLVSASDTLISNRTKPICPVPEMNYGSMPIDDGYLILEKEDYLRFVAENPQLADLARPYAGGQELIKGKERWCLWLDKVSPSRYASSSFIRQRLSLTQAFRAESKRPQTQKMADFPYLFGEIRQPDTTMLVVPKVSSERRRYIPIVLLEPSTIVNGSALIVPEADLFTFGVLISNVHMAWMRTVAGRMEMRYQYSSNVVYNNFPWPEVDEKTRSAIAKTAQSILDARALYPDSSLADLYDELTMPVELRRAHQENDKAVMAAYGFHTTLDGKKRWLTESETVAELFRLYEELTKP